MKLVAPDHSFRVGRSPKQPTSHWIGIRNQGPYLVVLINKATLLLTTVQAHKQGWELLRTADDCIRTSNDGVLWRGHQSNQSVVWTINGSSVVMQPARARKIAAALLRRSDYADDFQLQNNVRMIR